MSHTFEPRDLAAAPVPNGVWFRCAMVAAAIGIAVALNLTVQRYLPTYTSIAFIPVAVVLAALVGGLRVGLATTIAATLAFLFLLEPATAPRSVPDQWARVLLVLIEGALLSIIVSDLEARRGLRARHWPERYGAALLIVAAALGVKMFLLDGISRESPFVLMYAAVALAAWAGGLGPSLVATGLAAVAADWFWLQPVSAPSLSTDDICRLALFVGEGALIGITCTILHDASCVARRQQEMLAQSAHLNQRLLDSAREHAIILLDAAGVIVHWNAGASRIFGCDAGQAVGRPFADFAASEDRAVDTVAADIQESLARGRSERVGWRERDDGSRFWCETIIATDGNGQGYALVVRDISARHQAEEALRQNEESARQAQRLEAVGRLAGGIAHDFNNLLTVILGNLDLLAEHESPSELAKTLLDDVRAAGRRAAVLTRQLLSFSRREPAAPRRIDLNAVVLDMGSMLRRVIAEHIVLSSELQPQLAQVMADPGQMEQIVLNLVVNARDAMPKGGKLTIRTTEMHVSARDLPADAEGRAGRYIVLSVSDTGHGMDATTQARMFEPFFTTKEFGKGTGLGLATVYGNVKQAGGWVTVESRLGLGSTFRVFLPVAEGVTEVVGRADLSSNHFQPRGSETILLVEDEAPLRDLARRTLESAGYTVLAAKDGRAGAEASTHFTGKIDLVVTDLIMPMLNGRELAKFLKAQRADLKVLFMSGYTESTLANLGSLEPDEELLDKPFRPTDLARKVREMLDRRTSQ